MKGKTKWVIGIILVVLIGLVGGYYGYIAYDAHQKAIIAAQEEAEREAEAKAKEEQAAEFKKFVDNLPLTSFESVYVDYGTTSAMKNNHQVSSASMIKVFILSYLFQEVEAGHIKLTDTLTLTLNDMVDGAGVLNSYDPGTVLAIDQLAEFMIKFSDNTATNMLIDRLGKENINNYIHQNGYADSQLVRRMMDNTPDGSGRNMTSAKDLGTWFTKLMNGDMLSSESRAKMIHYLLLQEDTEMMPTALPKRRIAHKTGEIEGVYHDGGIVYFTEQNDKDKAYVLVLLSEPYEYRQDTINHMKELSQMIDAHMKTILNP